MKSGISFLPEIRQELDNILQWWMTRMTDHENGGFYGRIDGNGVLHPQADKGVILNARILWTFSAAARLTGNAAYKATAARAYQYFSRHFIDPHEGGVFWTLNYLGEPLQDKKQIYAQAFAAYALSEYFLLTRDQAVLQSALEIFWLVERYSRDIKNGGYFEAFSRGWGPLGDIRLSEKEIDAEKTMNTNLHVLEAFTNLYRAFPNGAVRAPLQGLIECFLDKFIDPETHHLHLFFDKCWNLLPGPISFGHDIECSWLLLEAAEALGDEALLKRVSQTALRMAEATLREGVDTDGGLFNEIHPDGAFDTDKHWWPQAEGVVGFNNAWQLSGDDKYLKASQNCWAFIKRFLKDEKEGEWHWRTDREGVPVLTEDKAGPWKCPYHNGRMALEIIKKNK